MAYIIGFVVINCIIAIFFERKNWRIASQIHALFFVVMLLVFLGTSCVSYVKAVVDCAYDITSDTLINGEYIHYSTIIIPCFAIEIVILFFLFLACTITVVKAVEYLLKGSAKQPDVINHSTNLPCQVITSADEVFHTKIYLRNCSYIC